MPENNVMIICVGCPLGCEITLSLDEKNEVYRVRGNHCKEGRAYALEEYQRPARVLTSTVRTENSSRPLLPVKTTKPVLRDHLMQCMFAISRRRVAPPIKIGEVIMANILGTGADLIASDDLPL